jgi:hypothetical protein
MGFSMSGLEYFNSHTTSINRQEDNAMSDQTIIERAMLRQYCEKQKEERAARGIKPSDKDIANKAANTRLLVMFRIGVKP